MSKRKAGLLVEDIRDYAGVDLEIVWQVVIHALPDLVAGLSAITPGDRDG